MLTDVKIRNAAPRERAFKLFDGDGLFLLVKPNGTRVWRFRYRVAGRTARADAGRARAARGADPGVSPRGVSREKVLALGAYPTVGLKKARKRRDAARDQLEAGLDPAEHKKAERVARAAASETFATIAEEWFDLQARKLAAATKVRDRRILDRLTKKLGTRPFGEIDTPELLAVLRTIEALGHHETARRALGFASRIWGYALAVGKATRDVSAGLDKALAAVVVKSHPAITEPARLAELLKAIDAYHGQPATRAALMLLPLVFTRPGELRRAEWREFDVDLVDQAAKNENAQWIVPAERMKLRREHVVPLSRQTVAILRELHQVTGRGDLVFPSLRPRRPISENTLNIALRTLGFAGTEHVAHGFRSTASTLLHELGFAPDVIETQLAHSRPGVAGVYNRSHLLPQRRAMMQAWADYLETLKAGDKVVAIRRSKRRRSS